MKTDFTKEFILSQRGCYSREQVIALSFIDKETITLKDMLTSELPIKDKFWWLCKKCALTKDENVLIAIKCAKTVLYLFENKYPYDKRPRKAIEAAEEYLKTHNAAAYAAANAAYAAADAAAAYAAADAAYAADAADAVAYADAAHGKIQKQCVNTIRKHFPNPPQI